MTPEEFLAFSIDAGFVMVMLSIGLGFYRIAKGESLADRVVALDMITVTIVAFCGLYAILSGAETFLDVAIVIALVGFLATVAMARFAERAVIRRREAEREKDQ